MRAPSCSRKTQASGNHKPCGTRWVQNSVGDRGFIRLRGWRHRVEWAVEPAADGVIIDCHPRRSPMTITFAHITPLVALIVGILILLFPRLLNYVVAIYLIIVGIAGLNSIHHFIR